MKWGTLRLGDVIDIKHGYAFKGEHFSNSGNYVLLTPGNCNESGGLKLRGEKEKFYVGEIPTEYILGRGDLLVVMTDLVGTAPMLGGAFRIPTDDRFLHNQRLGLVKITNSLRIDARFLYYLLNTYDYRAQIRGSASGATVRHTSPGRIRAATVRIPLDVPDQKAIAGTLSAYDDLIDNNRRRIQLLENSVRLLFEEWFARLNIPSNSGLSNKAAETIQWTSCTLSDICLEVKVSVLPTDLDADTPYIGLEHLPRRSITLCDWGQASDVSSLKLRFSAGDIIFGKIRPYFHKVGVALTNGVCSSDSIVIRAKQQEWYSYLVAILSSDPFIASTSQAMKEGTKMPRADWKQMKAYPIRLPDLNVAAQFSSVVLPVLAQLKTLALQSRQLQLARDLLLPRLMSGEIEV